jgi:hypothetical protein
MIDYKRKLRRALFVLIGASIASFVTMIVVQALMGGIRDIELIAGKSFMVGFGMAVFIALLPSERPHKYPWQ